MRSIQARMVIAFLLLIFLAMQFIGAFLLRDLESYYLNTGLQQRLGDAGQLAREAAQFFAAGPDQLDRRGLEQLMAGKQGANLLAVVLDRQGIVLAATDFTLVGQRFVLDVVLDVLETAAESSGTRPVPGSDEIRVFGAAPIAVDDTIVGLAYVEGDLTGVYETLAQVRQRLWTATSVALLVTGVLVFFVARTITGPIQTITQRAAAMAAGRFDQPIEIRSQDEVGRLAGMFNHMAERLRDTLTEMADEKRKVEAIVSHMADGVLAVDAEGRLLFINPAARAMLAVAEPEEALIGRHPKEIWADLPIGDTLARVLAGDDSDQWPSATDEGLHLTLGDRVLRASVAPIRRTEGTPGTGGQGTTVGAVWVMHDVTEFAELDRMRKEFVANVSHELRTPLTTIKSYVETLLHEDMPDGEMQRQFLRVVDAEADRMSRLVQDLLQLSQLDYRRVQWDLEYIRLSELVDQAYRKLQAQAEAKDLRWEHRHPDDEPLVYVDPDRIQQVILNLLSNAIEFTPPGGSITVTVGRDKGHLRVAVSDTGIGIPAEDLPRIFDRFYRVDKARARTLGGTGLGLAIAREIIAAHGGQMGIESVEGQGTTVWFTVPHGEEAGRWKD